MFRPVILSCLALSLLGACATTSQYTSGQAYLATYDHSAYESSSEIDNEIKQIAAIEPRLAFPARVGLACIQRGKLTSVPADEGKAGRILQLSSADHMENLYPSPHWLELWCPKTANLIIGRKRSSVMSDGVRRASIWTMF